MRRKAPYLPLAFLLGFFSLFAQTLLFREHLLAYSGNEIGIAVFFFAWMLGIAAGATVCAALPVMRGRGAYPYVLALYPVTLAAQLLLFWNLRSLAGIVETEPFPLDLLLFWTTVTGWGVSFVTGVLFSATSVLVAVERRETPGGSVALVYGVEAAGSFAGGLAATMLLLSEVSFPVLLAATATVWGAGGVWYCVATRRRGPLTLHVVLLLVVGVAWLPSAQQEIARLRIASMPIPRAFSIRESTDTPYQNVTVATMGRTTAIFSDGDLVASSQPGMEELERAAVLYAMVPGAARVLVAGPGAEGLLCELLRGPAEDIVHVQADEGFAAVVDRHFAGAGGCSGRNRITRVFADPRNYLATGRGGRFDLVVLAIAEPRTAQAAKYYTAEFFALVRSRLTPRGLFSFAATVTENVLRGAHLSYASTLYATLAVSFAKVTFTGGQHLLFFAGGPESAVTGTPAELATQFAPVAPLYPEFPGAAFEGVFEPSRIVRRLEAFQRNTSEEISRDSAPAVYLLNLFAEHRTSALLPLFERVRRSALPASLLALLALLVAMLVLRRRDGSHGPRRLPALLFFSVGFAALGGQLALLLAYQSRFGSIFAEFGLLNALFMVGLTAGAAPRFPWGRAAVVQPVGGAVVRPFLLVAALAGSGALMSVDISSWPLLSRALFFVAPAAIGSGAGACLRLGTQELEAGGESAHGVAGWLGGLDHLGALAGSVCGGLVLLPLLGPAWTAFLGAGLVAISLVLRTPILRGAPGSRAAGGISKVPGSGLRLALLFLLVLSPALGLFEALGGEDDRGASSRRVEKESTIVSVGTDSGGCAKTVSSLVHCGHIQGYGGVMELLVHLDEYGKVASARLGRHQETPEYLYGFDEWLDSFRGKSSAALNYGAPGEADGVEALTGATMTGRAAVSIIRCMAEASAFGPADTHSAAVPAQAGWKLATVVPWIVGGALVVAGFLLYFFAGWTARTLFLLLVIALPGLLWNQQLASDGACMVLTGSLPPFSNIGLWIALGSAAVGFLLAGAHFCGYLCPLGALSDILSRIGLAWRVTSRWDRRLRSLKYLLAIAVLSGYLAAGARGLCAFDPLLFIFRRHWDVLSAALVLLTVGGALVWHRPWCRYLCPLGAVLSVGEEAALLSRWGRQRDPARCHLGIVPGVDWDCIRCNRCAWRELPRPRGYRPALSRILLLCWLAAFLVLGGARVATTFGRLDGPSSIDEVRGKEVSREPGPRPGTPGPPAGEAGPPAGEAEPRLQRKDNDQYDYQRSVEPSRIRRLIESGSLSGREADFYLPVPGPGE